MFIWVTLPKHIDAMKLLDAGASPPRWPSCRARRSTPTSRTRNTLRLSFVTVPPERIREGIAILGKLIAGML